MDIQEKNLSPHKYGCLMGLLPPEIAKQITDFATEEILECHLDPVEGIELNPHLTFLYGFELTPEEILPELKAMLIRHGPVHVKLGGLSLFTGGDTGSVLKIDVESFDLVDLYDAIAQSFPHHDKYGDYRPHITIAYLRPENADYYANLIPDFIGKEFDITLTEYSSADNYREKIPLTYSNEKSMSYMGEVSGGALVPPAKQPKSLVFDPEGTKLLRNKYKRKRISAPMNEHARQITDVHLIGLASKSFDLVKIKSRLEHN